MLTAKDNTGHGPAAIRGVVEKMKVANLCRFHDYLPQNEEEGLLVSLFDGFAESDADFKS